MSVTGDRDLVNKRIPRCQRLILKGTLFKVGRIFLFQPVQEQRLLVTMAQIIISRHSDTTGGPLVNHLGLFRPNASLFLICFLFSFVSQKSFYWQEVGFARFGARWPRGSASSNHLT